MGIADIIRSDARERDNGEIRFVEVPEHMRLTSQERREDSARLRARFTRNATRCGGFGWLG